MLELRKLELATGLAILYTLKVPGRFDRFANRVLGRDADKAERDKLKEELNDVWNFLKSQIEVTEKTLKSKGQQDTPEGYGRLDALNRIGNQVFYTDYVKSNLRATKTTCTPTMRPSASRRCGPCRGCGGRNTTLRSSSR